MQEDELRELMKNWHLLKKAVTEAFGMEPDLQTLLFLIGLQELGKGGQKFDKEEKMNLMHVATCKVLSIYGFYKLDHIDEDGWPHYVEDLPLPALSLKEQDLLLKKAVVTYFQQHSFI